MPDQVINRYIKADTLEVVEKLTDKYEYFRKDNKKVESEISLSVNNENDTFLTFVVCRQ
jgi:hypothetical protein